MARGKSEAASSVVEVAMAALGEHGEKEKVKKRFKVQAYSCICHTPFTNPFSIKNLLLLTVVATLLAGIATTTFASPKPTVYGASVKKYPLDGYDNGVAAGKRWVAANHPIEAQLGRKWHEVLCQVEFNTSQPPNQGRADYWQGFADSLNYYDNDNISYY